MQLSRIPLLAALLALAVALTACGGDDNGGGGDEDPAELLRTALSGSQEMKSAVVDVSVDGEIEGDQGGTFSLSVTGPSQSENKGIGSTDLDVNVEADIPGLAALTGGGDEVSLEGGVTIVDEKLFVEWDGETYVADEQTFEQFAPGLGDVLSASTSPQVEEAEADEFIDSLEDLKNEGTEEIEGVETTHVSGKLSPEGIETLAEQQGRPVPGLDLGDLDPIDFDMYIGTEDNLMRRMEMGLDMDLPEEAQSSGAESLNFSVSVTLSEVNEPQTIEAPKGARPMQELIDKVSGSLGLFGLGLGSGAGLPDLGGMDDSGSADDAGAADDSGPGADSGNGGSGKNNNGAAPAGSPEAIADCLQKAGQDPDEIEACLTQ